MQLHDVNVFHLLQYRDFSQIPIDAPQAAATALTQLPVLKLPRDEFDPVQLPVGGIDAQFDRPVCPLPQRFDEQVLVEVGGATTVHI